MTSRTSGSITDPGMSIRGIIRAVPAALALGFAAGALSSCTVASGGHPQQPDATVRPVAVASPAAVGRPPSIGMEALYAYFPATGAQFTVGAQFRGKLGSLEDKLLYPCMARSGFNLGSVPSAQALASSDYDNSQFPDLGKIQSTGILSPQGPAPVPALPPTASTSVKRAYNADLQRCSNNAAEPALNAFNSMASDSANEWIHEIGAIESSAPVEAKIGAFKSCAELAGMPVHFFAGTSSADLLGSFLAWVTGEESRTSTDSQRVAADRHWATVFLRCSGPVVHVLEQRQLLAQKTFFRSHQQQLQRIQQGGARLLITIAGLRTAG